MTIVLRCNVADCKNNDSGYCKKNQILITIDFECSSFESTHEDD